MSKIEDGPAFGQWQPIETAPKDGTKIDLFYPYPRGRTINCYWMGEHAAGWVWRRPTWGAGALLPESEWDIGSYPNLEPTHWMRLPPPPADAMIAARKGGSHGE